LKIIFKTVNTRFSNSSSKRGIKYSNTEKLFKIGSTRKTSRSISKEAKSFKKSQKDSNQHIINNSNLSVASTSGIKKLAGYSSQPRLKSSEKILPKLGIKKRIASPKIDFVELNKKRALYFSKSPDRRLKSPKSDSDEIFTPSQPKRLKSKFSLKIYKIEKFFDINFLIFVNCLLILDYEILSSKARAEMTKDLFEFEKCYYMNYYKIIPNLSGSKGKCF
jgi:hypothetical protein